MGNSKFSLFGVIIAGFAGVLLFLIVLCTCNYSRVTRLLVSPGTTNPATGSLPPFPGAVHESYDVQLVRSASELERRAAQGQLITESHSPTEEVQVSEVQVPRAVGTATVTPAGMRAVHVRRGYAGVVMEQQQDSSAVHADYEEVYGGGAYYRSASVELADGSEEK